MGEHSIELRDVLAFEADHSTERKRYSDIEGITRDIRSMRIADSGCDQKGEWSGYVSAVQETERRRIASELHDGLGQMLTVLTMELRSAKIVALSCNPLVPALGLALERAYASARQAIDELRRSVMNLYPSMLDDLGIVASLSAVLREAREADPRLRIDADITVSDAQVPAALRIVAFRVVQEAVNNVLKHSGAQFLKVIFSYKNDFLTLSIVDDGQGIAPKILQEQRICSGISGMVRRVEASGGEIEVSSVVGSGTRIAVVWNTVMLRQ